MKAFAIWTAPLLLAAVPALAQQSNGDSKPGGAASPALQTAPATTPTTVVAIMPTVTAPAKPKKVCRSEAVTGSRIGNTVCHTKEQWAAIDEANQEAAKRFVDGRAGNAALNTGGGGGMGGVNTAAGVIGLP